MTNQYNKQYSDKEFHVGDLSFFMDISVNMSLIKMWFLEVKIMLF